MTCPGTAKHIVFCLPYDASGETYSLCSNRLRKNSVYPENAVETFHVELMLN
jgi:hypothetical protein